MYPPKSQVVHDLAMACVNGVIQDKVLKENRSSAYGITDAGDLVIDAFLAYKMAWDMIFTQIDIKDE